MFYAFLLVVYCLPYFNLKGSYNETNILLIKPLCKLILSCIYITDYNVRSKRSAYTKTDSDAICASIIHKLSYSFEYKNCKEKMTKQLNKNDNEAATLCVRI